MTFSSLVECLILLLLLFSFMATGFRLLQCFDSLLIFVFFNGRFFFVVAEAYKHNLLIITIYFEIIAI